MVLVTRSPSDDDLLTVGGPDGFALFYRRHVDSILRYYARATRDPEVAADLTAEAFAAALEAKPRFTPGGPPAGAWLFGIASRKLADYHRRGYAEDRVRRRLGMERIDLSDADLRRIEGLADEVEVISLVDELPADQRRAVTARVVQERAYGADLPQARGPLADGARPTPDNRRRGEQTVGIFRVSPAPSQS